MLCNSWFPLTCTAWAWHARASCMLRCPPEVKYVIPIYLSGNGVELYRKWKNGSNPPFLPVKRDQTLTLGDSCLAFSLLCSAIPTDAQGTLQMWLKLEFESPLYSHGRYLHVSLKECSLKCTVNSFNIHSYYSLIKTLITVTSHWVCPFVFFYLLKISEQIHSFWAQYFCTRLRGFSVYDVLPLSSIKIFWMLCVLSCYCPMTS